MMQADNQIKASIPSTNRSQFSQTKWKFFLDAPFEIGHQCCYAMKKAPAHRYTRETGRKPITAQMASESRVRTQQWIRNGCNGFDMKSPISNPMSFWTEQDVLLYIAQHNLPICCLYGKVVDENNNVLSEAEYIDGELFDTNRPTLHTTGCDRTGCVFCGFGCHMEKPGEGRFERMKTTHPTLYNSLMKPESEGGLGYKEKIDWINEHGNLDIQY